MNLGRVAVLQDHLHPVVGVTGVQLEKRCLENGVRLLSEGFPFDGLQMVDVDLVGEEFKNILSVCTNVTILIENSDVKYWHLVADTVHDVIFNVQNFVVFNLSCDSFGGIFDSRRLVQKRLF
jgi:hypothetical protein